MYTIHVWWPFLKATSVTVSTNILRRDGPSPSLSCSQRPKNCVRRNVRAVHFQGGRRRHIREENQAILEEACRYRSPYSIVSTIYKLKVRPGLSGKSILVIEGKSNNLAELRTRWTLKHGAGGGGLGGLLSQAFFVLTRRKQLFWRMQGQGLPLLKTSKKTRSLLWKSFIPPSSNSSLSILISEN